MNTLQSKANCPIPNNYGKVASTISALSNTGQFPEGTLQHIEKAICCGLSAVPDPLVESSWVGHVPFLHTLIAQLRPQTYLELGVFNGCSFFAASAALKQHGGGNCTGVDTWLGDVHCGNFKQGVYNWFIARKNRFYPESKIIQKTFADALVEITDESIDILHIDGTHTYEAVKEDYQTWLPKVSQGGVILFHDTMERKEDFGVWRLWEELADHHEYRYEFEHSHGLGLVVKGRPALELKQLLELLSHDTFLRDRFAAAGKNLVAMTTFHVEKQRALMKLKATENNQKALEREYSVGNAAFLAPEALSAELEKRPYLDLVKKIVLNEIYEPGDHLTEGKVWPPGETMTMVGRKRLENSLGLAMDVIEREIPGDFIEAGIWRGGVVAVWAALLKSQPGHGRKVYGADSFEGIPPAKPDQYPADSAHTGCDGMEILNDNSKARVEGYLSRLGLLSEDLVLVEGWFNETLANIETEKFAVIRADGDTYESTIQILENLYPKLSDGGYIIIDDYFSWAGCRSAVEEFRGMNAGACGELITVDWTAVYWRKV